MRKRLYLLFGCSFLLISHQVRGQSPENSLHPDSLMISQDDFKSGKSINLMDLIDTGSKPYYLRNTQPFLLPNSTGPLPLLLLPNSIGDEPALFCKIERNIETKSKLAPRFRLGSVNYTNWMEGKGEFYDKYRP